MINCQNQLVGRKKTRKGDVNPSNEVRGKDFKGQNDGENVEKYESYREKRKTQVRNAHAWLSTHLLKFF